jgi:Peptidase family M28
VVTTTIEEQGLGRRNRVVADSLEFRPRWSLARLPLLTKCRLNSPNHIMSIRLIRGSGYVAVAICAFILTALAQKQAELSSEEKRAIAAVDGARTRAVTVELTDDRYEGRGIGQPGGERAARYLAEQFKEAGLKPLGYKNGYLQSVAVRSYRTLASSSIHINGVDLKSGIDFVVVPLNNSRAALRPRMLVSGPVVLAGLGVRSRSLALDDLRGMPIAGSVVILFDGMPEKATVKEWAAVDLMAKITELVREKPALVLVASDNQLNGPTMDLASRRGVVLANMRPGVRPLPPVVTVSGNALRKVLASTSVDYDAIAKRVDAGEFVSRELPMKAAVDLRFRFDKTTAPAYNVIGYIEGSDDKLRSEAVVYTAHLDAYGKEPDGRIFAGAGDDAVGVAGMLSIAQALTRTHAGHRRSVVFIATTGEELGKLGAYTWVHRLTWDLTKVVANVNMDGIGSEAWGRARLFYAIGLQQSPSLTSIVWASAAALGIDVVLDEMVNAQLLQRSDAFEFAQQGILPVYGIALPGPMAEVGPRFGPWLRDIVHYEKDRTSPDWNWDGVADVDKLFLLIGVRIANATERPGWDQGSPFKVALTN